MARLQRRTWPERESSMTPSWMASNVVCHQLAGGPSASASRARSSERTVATSTIGSTGWVR